MKKILAMILALAMCLSLAACSGGGSKESQQPSSNPGTSSQAPESRNFRTNFLCPDTCQTRFFVL